MKVAVFGSTGFVGSYIVDKLLEKSFVPKVLIRENSKSKIKSDCEKVYGNIDNENSIQITIEGTDAIIYNVGIIREFKSKNITFQKLHFSGVKTCIEIAKNCGVKRFILMSANGVNNNGTEYQRTKWQAEELLKQSDLNWTIFRPSLIFGDPRGHGRPEFCNQLKKDMLSLPFPAPLFYEGLLPNNAGTFSMSPIHVKNVADFFVNAINMEETKGKIYNLGGPEILTWKTIIHNIALASGKLTWKMPAPVGVIKAVASIFDKFEWFPVTRDQLTMLLEGNTVNENYFNDFKITPIPFKKENLEYLA